MFWALLMGMLIVTAVSGGKCQASPLAYQIDFTGSGTLPQNGSFLFDSQTATFSNFLVQWAGATFEMTSAANVPASGTGCSGGGLSGGALGFEIVSGSGACLASQLWSGSAAGLSFYEIGGTGMVSLIHGFPTLPAAGQGLGTFTIAQVPEAPHLAPIAVALGALGLFKKMRVKEIIHTLLAT